MKTLRVRLGSSVRGLWEEGAQPLKCSTLTKCWDPTTGLGALFIQRVWSQEWWKLHRNYLIKKGFSSLILSDTI